MARSTGCDMTRRGRTYSRFRNALAALIILAIAVAVGWQYFHDRPTSPQPDAGPSPTATPNYDAARRQMEALPVHGWDRVSDFQRFRFGEAWSDDVNVAFGHNGCNTRDDILRRDLADLQVRPGTCFAQSGVLHDPYTGASIDFVRGPDTSSTVQIDHVVSLADAWYKGARLWDDQRRRDSPTIREICWPWGERSTSTRLFATSGRGCRRTPPFGARSSPALSR